MSEDIMENIRIVSKRLKSFENTDGTSERLWERGIIGNEKIQEKSSLS